MLVTQFYHLEAILRNALKAYDPVPSSYWWAFPPNTTKDELDQLAAVGQFNVLSGLAGCILYCIFFGVMRLFLQKYVIKPLATVCLDLTFTEEKSFGKIYEKNCTKMTKDTVIKFCSEHNLNEKEVKRDIWNRKRNAICQKKFVKFTEASWRFLFYSTFLVLGYFTLFTPETAPYVYDLDQLWTGFPHSLPNDLMKTYYLVELGCYLHQIMWTEVQRLDALEMIVHHVVTILLLVSSHMQSLQRIGVVILFLHDLADIFLELGKCFNYIAKVQRFHAWAQPITDILFVLFAVVFFVTRLVLYPQCIYSYLLCPEILGGHWPMYWPSMGLLITLQCLHIFWFYLILRMVYKLISTGGIAKDERSDHESDIGEYSERESSHIKEDKKRK